MDTDGYVVVGALARVDQDCRQAVCDRIDALEGLSTFAVEDPLKVGVLIEAKSLDQAHIRFTDQLSAIDGVLGAWPVSVESDEGFAGDPPAQEHLAVPHPADSRSPGSHAAIQTQSPSTQSEAIR